MTTPKRPIQSLCCFGEVMIELINGRDGNIALGVAGDTYNTAVYIKRLLAATEVTVSYCTALGTDPYSDIIRSALTEYDLDTSCVETRSDKIPGLYAVDTDDAGERSFTYWRSDAAARTMFQSPCEISLDRLAKFDLIYVSGISMAILPTAVRAQLIDFIAQFRANGGTVAYDSNYRPRLWEDQATAQQINTRMWQLADIALPSIDDEMALFGDTSESAVLDRLRGCGVCAGALKRGAEGPRDLAGQSVAQALETVDTVIDSTAAGDSFNAGYLAAYVQGHSPQVQMETGHNLAAKVITHRGAIIPA